MKEQCPRCNEYEYESSYSNRQLGCLIMIVVPLVIGGGAAYSGMSDDMVGYLTIGALILGLFIIPTISEILSILSLFINSNMPLIILFATKGPSNVREEYNCTKCAPHKIFTYAVLLSDTPPAAIKNNL